jgi:hypothetical protein
MWRRATIHRQGVWGSLAATAEAHTAIVRMIAMTAKRVSRKRRRWRHWQQCLRRSRGAKRMRWALQFQMWMKPLLPNRRRHHRCLRA